jgi:hypothetical protein
MAFMNCLSFPQYSNKITCRVSKPATKVDKDVCRTIGRDYGHYTYGSGWEISIID